ncbi:acyl carrier protein [Asanoa sp. WMMD1127]|uniref:acyl carrier protein n=1 Tax=Asanoa sp. WMMD1127 TaxID=3016107 RepID=UPI002416E5C0|nr:acyl carrier protein [Asanoa sp. WMMD1127]MDG4820757.1 acyl carrier protein [Asanoa sp. WMMD1127]
MFTIDDVRRIMREAAGEAESSSLDGDIGDVTFTDLGYDSLALLELAARVQQEYGVPMPDEALEHMQTPAETVTYVNDRAALRGVE